MKYDFDEVLDRRNSHTVKWDLAEKAFKRKEILPMWVADMDFRSPHEVTDALINRAKQAVFGYSFPPDSYFDAMMNWFKRRHHWKIEKEWIINSQGVVPAINFCLKAFSEKNDGVIIQPPIYPPFFSSVQNNGRRLISNPLKNSGGDYTIDFDDLESKIDETTKLLIFCNPHNPVGRVWQKEELEKLAAICMDRNILVISDEIHCDLVFSPNSHTPFAALDDKVKARTITLVAPSKTFNIAGLSTSAAIIADPDIREGYQKALQQSGLESVNLFGIVALEAAYRHGDDWLNQLLAYLKDNIDFALTFIKEQIPEIKVAAPQGTYLLWLDCRKLSLTHAALMHAVIKKAGLGVSSGRIFGEEEGDQFLRMNVGCPRALLEEGLMKLKTAFLS